MRQLQSEPDAHNKVFRKRHFVADAEGFVSKMRRTEMLLREAQQECERHHYSEASALLMPMTEEIPGPLAGPFFELLGRCATHGCAEDWPDLFRRAQTSYEAAGDELGAARILLYRGEAEAARGDFLQGSASLARASAAFTHQAQFGEAAHSAVIQARILLFQEKATQALEKIHWAVAQFHSLQQSGAEILARLLRAQVWVTLGNGPAASRDLLFSERLAEKAQAGAHLRVALARAETLLWSGFPHRAHTLLRPLAAAVLARDEIGSTAHYNRLCGQALKESRPQEGHMRLTEARELFIQLGQQYYVAECEIGRGIALRRLGQSGDLHWANVENMNVARWPVLTKLFQQAQHQKVSTLSPLARLAKEKSTLSLKPNTSAAPDREQAVRPYFTTFARLVRSFVNFLAGEPGAKRVSEDLLRHTHHAHPGIRPLLNQERDSPSEKRRKVRRVQTAH